MGLLREEGQKIQEVIEVQKAEQERLQAEAAREAEEATRREEETLRGNIAELTRKRDQLVALVERLPKELEAAREGVRAREADQIRREGNLQSAQDAYIENAIRQDLTGIEGETLVELLKKYGADSVDDLKDHPDVRANYLAEENAPVIEESSLPDMHSEEDVIERVLKEFEEIVPDISIENKTEEALLETFNTVLSTLEKDIQDLHLKTPEGRTARQEEVLGEVRSRAEEIARGLSFYGFDDSLQLPRKAVAREDITVAEEMGVDAVKGEIESVLLSRAEELINGDKAYVGGEWLPYLDTAIKFNTQLNELNIYGQIESLSRRFNEVQRDLDEKRMGSVLRYFGATYEDIGEVLRKIRYKVDESKDATANLTMEPIHSRRLNIAPIVSLDSIQTQLTAIGSALEKAREIAYKDQERWVEHTRLGNVRADAAVGFEEGVAWLKEQAQEFFSHKTEYIENPQGGRIQFPGEQPMNMIDRLRKVSAGWLKSRIEAEVQKIEEKGEKRREKVKERVDRDWATAELDALRLNQPQLVTQFEVQEIFKDSRGEAALNGIEGKIKSIRSMSEAFLDEEIRFGEYRGQRRLLDEEGRLPSEEVTRLDREISDLNQTLNTKEAQKAKFKEELSELGKGSVSKFMNGKKITQLEGEIEKLNNEIRDTSAELADKARDREGAFNRSRTFDVVEQLLSQMEQFERLAAILKIGKEEEGDPKTIGAYLLRSELIIQGIKSFEFEEDRVMYEKFRGLIKQSGSMIATPFL